MKGCLSFLGKQDLFVFPCAVQHTQDFHGFGADALEDQVAAVDAAANAGSFMASKQRKRLRHESGFLA